LLAQAKSPEAPPVRRPRIVLLTAIVMAALTALLTLHRLGAADVCGFNEAVEGVFVQQMVEHGKLLFPLENGRAPMYKPPLFHWTATALDRVAGVDRVTAFNLRLPSALYAIACVALTTCFAGALLGWRSGLLAGAILCGAYQFIEQGRIGRVDMTLCFFETLALFLFCWWLPPGPLMRQEGRAPRDWLRYAFAAALGLAVLAKGPIGAILPAAACGVFLLLERRFDAIRRLAAPGPILVALVIGGSWYLACYFAGRDLFLDRQLGSENLGRFFGSLGAMKPWYYVKPVLLNSAPLSLIVPVAIYFALRTYWRDETQCNDRVLSSARLFALFWIITVAFFSIAAYKRRAYLLPLWPASAVTLAWFARELQAKLNGALPSLRRLAEPAIAVLAAGSIIFNFAYFPSKEIRDCGTDSYRAAAAEIDRLVGPHEPLYSYKLGAEPATLLFYLDRKLPPLSGRLGEALPGYVIVPLPVWAREKNQALDLTPVYTSTSGKPPLVLLRHGPALARAG